MYTSSTAKNKNRFLIYGCLFLMVIFVLNTGSAYSGQPPSLNSLLNEAAENNPRIQSAYNNWKAAEHKIRVVEGLPDPMLNYGYFGEPVETRVGPQKNRFGASQKIPFPGKLNTKGQAQAKHAEMLREQYEAAKREIIKEVKFIYYDIFWIDKAIQTAEEEKSVLESMEAAARRRYELNTAPLQDALKAQVEITNTINKILSLNQHRKSSVAKMNSLLSRAHGSALASITDLALLDFE